MNKHELTKEIKSSKRNVFYSDVILLTLALSTASHLADVYGQGEPGFLVWVFAGSVSFIELMFARAISKAQVTNSTVWPLWVILSIIMILIIPVNLVYAWSQAHKLSFERYTDAIIGKDIVINYLAVTGSGIISLLIAGMAIVRTISVRSAKIAEDNLTTWIAQDHRRKADRARAARQRAEAEANLDEKYIDKKIAQMSGNNKPIRRRTKGKK